MTKLEATSKVQRLRLSFTDEDLVKKIGISKPTLYARITKHNWKVSEIYLIESFK
jgi:predicted DNA-binding transcriptional regulator AlpA